MSITKSQGKEEYPKDDKRRKASRIGLILRRNCLLKHFMEVEIKGRLQVIGRRGSRLKQLLDDLEEKSGFWKSKESTRSHSMDNLLLKRL